MFSPRRLIPFLLETAAYAEDPEDDKHKERLSPTPFHLGADVSVKPGFAAHAIAGWLPWRHYGLNVCGRTAYEQEEGLYYEARGGPTFRFGKHGAWVVAPSFGFEHIQAEHAEEPWSWRTGTMLAYTQHDFETVGVLEFGGATGLWYSMVLNGWIDISGQAAFGAGAYAQGDEGFGPWLGGRLGHLSLGLAPVVKFEDEELKPGLVALVELARH